MIKKKILKINFLIRINAHIALFCFLQCSYCYCIQIQVGFEDVLAEPAGAHSVDCVWKASYFCFNCGKNCCYNILAALCGIFIALGWGCEFAWITFSMVWCITPCLRLYSILMGCLQKYFGTCITCFLAPICETCGLLFSRITVSNVK